MGPGEARADGRHGPAGPLACGVAHHHVEAEGELLVILKVKSSYQRNSEETVAWEALEMMVDSPGGG